MKSRLYCVGLALVLAGVLAGCATTSAKSGALFGGVVGAGLGAIVGNQSGHEGEGALIGAGVGALTGGIIGHELENQSRKIESLRSKARPDERARNGHYELRVVRGPNGERYERRVWVRDE